MYHFTTDWFTRNIPLWEKQLAHLRNNYDAVCCEVGSYEGRSAVWLLDNILTPTSKLICIDTFKGSREHAQIGAQTDKIESTFDLNVSISGKQNQVIKLKGESFKQLQQLNASILDFIYIDGAHSPSEVLTDACLAFPLVKSGGLMAFDDYDWKLKVPESEKPKIGIDAFLAAFEGKYTLLEKDQQVWIQKL